MELPLDTQEYYERIMQYSPTRRVPALIDGALKIWDSLAICEYANDLSGGRGWPVDARERAHARAISAEMHSGFQALRTSWPMNARAQNLQVTPTPETLADIARIDAIWQECRNKYSQRGSWLFGEFSIADAMYAPVVLRFKSYCAKVSTIAQQYMATTLADRHVQAWLSDSRPR
jgi:glutathione S-transferase